MRLIHSEESEQIALWRKDLGVFALKAGKHYFAWIACALVSTIGFAGQRYFTDEATVSWWGIALAGICVSCFQAWRDERREVEALTEKLRVANEASISKTDRVLLNVCDFIKAGKTPLAALQLAEADELENNEAIVSICDALVAHGHPHPFEQDLKGFFQPELYLTFLRTARLSTMDLGDIHGVYNWMLRNYGRKLEDLPADTSAAKPPSQVPDKAEPPPSPTSTECL